MGGKSGTTSIRSPRLDVFRIQSSTYGRPIPLAWGQPRLPGNLLWYGNFHAIPHTTVESSGGKGGGGATTETTTFSYEAAVAVGLCEGAINGLGWIWRGKEKFTAAQLGFSLFTGTPQQTPWAYLSTNFPAQAIGYEDLAYVANAAYQLTDNAELHNHNFEIKARLQLGSFPALAKTFTTVVSTCNSTANGFKEGWIVRLSSTGVLPYPLLPGVDYRVHNPSVDAYNLLSDYGGAVIIFLDTNTGTHTATRVNFEAYNRTVTANTSTNRLLATAHPFLNDWLVRITTTGVLPPPLVNGGSYYVINETANDFQVALTVGGAAIDFIDTNSGTHTATPYRLDANPKEVVNDVLTNANYGVGFPGSKIADLTQYSNYCLANNILVSPALLEQRQAADFIKTLLDLTNSEAVWSDGKLKIVPYGDTAATGNGVTFTPDLTSQFDLTDDDYCPPEKEPPVRQLRKPPADAFNQVQVEFLNRRTQYNIETAEAKDQANIELYGLRPKSVEKLNEIVEPDIAAFVAQARLQRALYIRNEWRWRLSMSRSRLEPMDVGTLTESRLGLVAWPVRVTAVTETDDGYLEFEAEDFPLGLATPAFLDNESAIGFNADYNALPGDVNVPVIFTAPGILTPTGYEVWCAVSGSGANWGGCEVHVSTDGASYQNVGSINGRARHGVTHTSIFPSGVDPDTVNTLKADLTTSQGSLLPGSQQDADQHNTLCLVGSEVIAYSEATLTAANKYDLDTYIRRGVFNSPIASAAVGTRFVRLDQALFRNVIDSTLVGQTLFFKFPSFNIYGGARQNIADVAEYQYTVGASLSYPSNVTRFTIDGTTLSWESVPDVNVIGYLLRYQPGTSRSWGDAIALHNGDLTSSPYDILVVPAGPVVLMVKARDSSGNESQNAAMIVTDLGDPLVANVVESFDRKAAGFPGIKTNCSVSDGNLVADAITPLMWKANAQTAMWADDSATLMWAVLQYAPLTYVDSVNLTQAGEGSQLTIERAISGDPWSLEYGENSPNLLWAADSATLMWATDSATLMWAQTQFLPWPGQITAKNSFYDFRIKAGQANTQGQVMAFTLIVDMPDVDEVLDDIVIAVDGTRLPIAKSYRTIKNVQLTVQADGGAAISARIDDKHPALGPLIHGLDIAGMATSALVDARIQGY